MSQNLTQPEEVDYVLMEMARHDMAEGRLIQDDARSHALYHGFACDWSMGAADPSCGAAHKESMRR
jgi:hypothetical protein